MKTNLIIAAAVGLLMAAGGAAAQLAEPKVKTLAAVADPLKKAVLIGRVATGNMVLQLELEGSEYIATNSIAARQHRQAEMIFAHSIDSSARVWASVAR